MNPLQNLRDVIGRIERQLKAPVAQREKFEREMERKLGRVWREQRDKLIPLLGNPPSLANVPESYWNNSGAAIRKVIAQIFESVFMSQAEALIAQVGIGVDWTLINQRAADWALTHTVNFITGIQNTERQTIADLINKFFSSEWSLEDLAGRINSFLFDSRRASQIAITEVTRAAVQAEVATVNILEAEYRFLNFKPFWITANDDRVCEICGPRHMKEIDGEDFPPAHVNCRCEVFYDMKVDKP